MPQQLLLEERTYCAVCRSQQFALEFECEYSEPDLVHYLTEFYGGRLEPDSIIGGPYRVVQCKSCGLLMQQFVPSSESLGYLYDSVAVGEEASEDPVSSISRSRYSERVRTAARLLRGTDSKSVLDVGAGWGGLLDAARSLGFSTYGIELSATRREFCSGRGHVMFSSIEEARWAGVLFDYAHANQVFEHLVEPAEAFGAMCQSLAPGGIIELRVPRLDEGVHRSIGRGEKDRDTPLWQFSCLAPLEHINCYAEKSLEVFAREYPEVSVFRPISSTILETRSARSLAGTIRFGFSRQRYVTFFRSVPRTQTSEREI